MDTFETNCLVSACSGGVAGFIIDIAFFPIDSIKTRIQVVKLI